MKFPAILRIWHGLNAVAIFDLLCTVLLRETLPDKWVMHSDTGTKEPIVLRMIHGDAVE